MAFRHYVETFDGWVCPDDASDDQWIAHDLSQYGVPPSAVVEIAIGIPNNVANQSAGVRKTYSSLDRRILVAESEGAGEHLYTILVQADTSGYIEYYSSYYDSNYPSNIAPNFYIVGWLVGCDYVEKFESFSPTSPSGWEGYALDQYGVSGNQVVDIALLNKSLDTGYEIGVRTSGSTLERKFHIKEAEKTDGHVGLTLSVSTSGDTAAIDLYAGDTTDCLFHLLGYFTTPPGDYVEQLTLFPNPTGDNDWQSLNVGAFGIPNSVVVQFALGHANSNDSNKLGVRRIFSALERVVDLDESEPDGTTPGINWGSMCVNIDSSGYLEYMSEDISDDPDFIAAGYWTNFTNSEEPFPHISSLNCFIEGRPCAQCDLYINGPNEFTASGNLFLKVSEPLLASCDLFISGIPGFISTSGDLFIHGHKSVNCGSLYFIDNISDNLSVCNLGGLNPRDIINAGNASLDLAIDTENDRLYFTRQSDDIIARSDIDGNNYQVMVTGLKNPTCIEVHHSSGLIFYCEIGPLSGSIGKCDFDGNNQVTIVSDPDVTTPYYMCIDEVNDKIYWTEWNNNKIKKADLTGNNIETVSVEPAASVLFGIDIDVENQKIYWADSKYKTIRRSNVDGTDSEVIISGILVDFPFCIKLDLFGRRIYYSDYLLGNIYSANLNGSDITQVTDFDSFEPLGLDLYIPFNLFISGAPGFVSTGDQYPSGISLYTYGANICRTDAGFSIDYPSGLLCYTQGSGIIPESGQRSLVIHGFITHQSSGSLFIGGHNSQNGSKNLFVNSHDAFNTSGNYPSGLPLNIGDGHEISYGSGNLFLKCPTPHSGEIYLYTRAGIFESLDLFALGYTTHCASGNLFTWGHLDCNESCTLLIGPPYIETSWTFYLKTESDGVNNTANLFIQGSLSGVNQQSSSTSLYIEAADVDYPYTAGGTESWTLLLKAPSGNLTNDNAWTMFLKADFTTPATCNLYTYGHASGENPHGNEINDSINLVCSVNPDDPSRIGFIPFNSDPWTLFLKCDPGQFRMADLYISGSAPTYISVSGNLFVAGFFGQETGITPLYLMGVSGVISNGPSGLSLFVGALNVYNTPRKLYTHGY